MVKTMDKEPPISTELQKEASDVRTDLDKARRNLSELEERARIFERAEFQLEVVQDALGIPRDQRREVRALNNDLLLLLAITASISIGLEEYRNQTNNHLQNATRRLREIERHLNPHGGDVKADPLAPTDAETGKEMPW
ncbi:MAG: hypothetical protein F4Y26_05260 [Gammaproteobacteria bacterium]|nr:hypothetical protein [Gammaproteobacteria bacterium]